MHEKIVEIIVYIIREMQDNKQLGDINLAELAQFGYTESEISTALSWVIDKIASGENVFIARSSVARNSHRIFHEVEKMVMTLESQGYLLMLREIGVIDDFDLEVIIDRIMVAGFQQIDLKRLKSIIATVVFEREETEVPGSRFLITSQDTVH